MFQWIEDFMNASAQTKYFVLNWIIYGLVILLSTLFCYGRLDYVRSYAKHQQTTNTTTQNPPQVK